MNPKLAKLLYEGFSINTLEKLNSKQLNALYNKVVKEETTVTSTKYNLKDVNDQKKFIEKVKTTADPNKVKVNPTDNTATVGEGEVTEKAVSRQQQKIMGLALSVKRGDTPKSKVTKKVKDMAKKMSEKDLEDFASTKHKGLPKTKETESKEEVKKLEESILNILEKHLPPHTTKGELINMIKRKN